MESLTPRPELENSLGYKPTRAGLVDTQPSPHNLHALITPPELLHLTHMTQNGRDAVQGKSVSSILNANPSFKHAQ